ncbi:hypothetical protein PIB30_057210 [Stylosanthes scabra]|uniref:Uncharacterized protein n=1 Tax=Stylosanthes scabra TaxID=79078 RepID=A0ABU6WHU9_9FABA|nr:hypothetical protein [Stylosanthes scabra]
MFIEFGVRVPFTDFQQRLLNRASVAPSQLHPNAWSSIRSFKLVTAFLGLPQDPVVFLCLFTFYLAYIAGKTKKGYMSVRPGKNRRIFGLYEDSFHDFKDAGLEPDEARKLIVDMAGGDATMSRLRWLVRPSPAGFVPTTSGPPPASRAQTVLLVLLARFREEIPPPPPSLKRKRPVVDSFVDPKRTRILEGGSREFFLLDRSFDASGFIEGHLLGPRAQEVLRDCDPMENVRWPEWAMLRATTIMKSVEPRLTISDEAERRNAKLLKDLKVVNLQKVVLEEERSEVMQAKLKAEKDLKTALAILVPDFNASRIDFFNDIVDGKVVDPAK